MITLTAHLNIVAFTEIANGLSREDSERVAAAFPDLFSSAFRFGDVPDIGSAPPAGPGPAKARPARTEQPIDMTALTGALHILMASAPRLRSEDYAAKVAPSDYHATAETIGAAVKRALERLVTTKAAYCEGKGRGRRYWLRRGSPTRRTPSRR